ncbi:MAG: 4Fe-4S dicluster domain-containing protein [Ruminococcus sp.]|nr:4Fe-4S dicluster domain-containing protein [Ruminococcus sp.]
MTKSIPILFEEEKECCGCTACYAQCSVNAITMVKNEEGFVYPQIDEEKCIGCYSCIRVCPLKNNNREQLI